LANLPDFLEKITLMPSSYRVSYYTFFNVNPEEPKTCQIKGLEF